MTKDEKQKEAIAYLKCTIETSVHVLGVNERIVHDQGANDSKWIMDFRRVALNPKFLDIVSGLFLNLIEDPTHKQVGGLEVAAIPLIAGIIMKSNEKGTPMNGFFMRKSRKKTGLLNMIEGPLTDDPIVIVDDILNSGASVMRQIVVYEELGRRVDSVLTILRFRDESYYEELHKRNIKIISLFTLDDFTSTLGVKNKIRKEAPVPYPFEKYWYFTCPGAKLEYVVPKSAPVLDGDRIYMGTDSGYFFCLDANTGKEIWSYLVPFGSKNKRIFSTASVTHDLVIFGAYDGNLYALDKMTGKRIWANTDCEWIGSSPCVSEKLGLIFVGAEFGFWKKKGGVIAVDLMTGKMVWRSESGDYTHGSPVYHERLGLVVCGSNDGIAYGLSARDGKILWTFDAGGEMKAAPTFSPDGSMVAIGTFNNSHIVLDSKSGTLIVRLPTHFGSYSTPVWNGNNTLIGTSTDKHVRAWDIPSGRLTWEHQTAGRIFASPVLYKGYIYIGGNDATLRILDSIDGVLVAQHRVSERITNRVAIDEKRNRVLVPTFANELIAVGPLK